VLNLRPTRTEVRAVTAEAKLAIYEQNQELLARLVGKKQLSAGNASDPQDEERPQLPH